VEWQLLLHFFATVPDRRPRGVYYDASRCRCPRVRPVDLLDCGNAQRAGCVSAEVEKAGRIRVVNAAHRAGSERRPREALVDLCRDGGCVDLDGALADPHAVRAADQAQRSCIDVCL